MDTPSQPPRALRTPCLLVCSVDPESGLCLGCRRTLEEIAQWARLTDEERDRIMVALPSRGDRIRPKKRGLS